MARRVSPATAVTTPGQHWATPTVVTPSWRRAISAISSAKRGRGTEAVSPHLHRHRPGMCGLTAEDQPLALDALGACHRADATTHRLEDRSLLDVHLDIRLDVGHPCACAVEVLDVDAVRGEDLGQLVALLVGQSSQDIDVERADTRRRAEQAAAEPCTLLVRPVDQRHGDRRYTFGGERPQQLQAGHHTECTVEPSTFRNAVEVAADHQHVVALAAQHGPQVPRLVLVDLDRQCGQRLAQHRPRLQPIGCPRQPATALRTSGVLGQGAQVGNDSFGCVGGHAIEISGSASQSDRPDSPDVDHIPHCQGQRLGGDLPRRRTRLRICVHAGADRQRPRLFTMSADSSWHWMARRSSGSSAPFRCR